MPILNKGNAKVCSNYHTIAHISHTSKVMLKILQARIQQCVNQELPLFKLDLEKAVEPDISLPTYLSIIENKENSRKTSTSSSLTTLKPLTVWITTNCGQFLKRWDTGPPYLPPEKSICRSRSNS